MMRKATRGCNALLARQNLSKSLRSPFAYHCLMSINIHPIMLGTNANQLPQCVLPTSAHNFWNAAADFVCCISFPVLNMDPTDTASPGASENDQLQRLGVGLVDQSLMERKIMAEVNIHMCQYLLSDRLCNGLGRQGDPRARRRTRSASSG